MVRIEFYAHAASLKQQLTKERKTGSDRENAGNEKS
jgi:hypothetical protein